MASKDHYFLLLYRRGGERLGDAGDDASLHVRLFLLFGIDLLCAVELLIQTAQGVEVVLVCARRLCKAYDGCWLHVWRCGKSRVITWGKIPTEGCTRTRLPKRTILRQGSVLPAELTAPAIRVDSLVLVLLARRRKVPLAITDEAGGEGEGVFGIVGPLAALQTMARRAASTPIMSFTVIMSAMGDTPIADPHSWLVPRYRAELGGVTLLATGEAGRVGIALCYACKSPLFRSLSFLSYSYQRVSR